MTALYPTDMAMTNLAAMFAAAEEGSTLVLPPGRHVLRAPLVLTKSLRVCGARDGTTVLDAQGVCQIFMILGNRKSYAFETLTFQGGAGRLGGAIAAPNRNAIAFEGCRFVANGSELGGGAALLHHANGYFRRCIFEQNDSTCGGALAVGSGCDMTVDRCIFVENEAEAGGAVFLDDDGALEIRSSTFVKNRARRADTGSGLYVFGSRDDGPSSFVANTIFSEEDALGSDPDGGGVVFVTHSVVPAGALAVRGVRDVGGNVVGPVELVDLGGGAWGLAPGSAAVGTADVKRIEPHAVDIAGIPLVSAARANPGALASPTP
jgi:hypothetical protein